MPKKTAIWKRVLLQVGLAIALAKTAPYTFPPLAHLGIKLYVTYYGTSWLTALRMAGEGSLLCVIAAVPAALISWWLVRRPWDALASCGALYSGLRILFPPQNLGWSFWLFEICNVAAIVLTCWAVAALARRREAKATKS